MRPDPPPRSAWATNWAKNRRLVRDGFKDLKYLPRSRSAWNATLAAHAFSARRRLAGQADLNLWAAMHDCAASARCAELGRNALILWHGTSAARAEKIRQAGLFSKKGVWAALEPTVAHSYTRGRSAAYEVGSATVVLVLDRGAIVEGRHYEHESEEIVRFFHRLPPEVVEYILWDDRVEFCGVRRAREPKPWGRAHFKRQDGRWVPRSRPPVRFDQDHAYSTLEAWLDLNIRRILNALGPAAAVEVFSSLYATIDPWDALEHEAVFHALDRLCGRPRQQRGYKQFCLGGPVPK